MDRQLDVSDLAAPEPLERILDALADLPPGDRLCVIHRREPYPLYDLLRRMGCRWETTAEDERYRILIWPAPHPRRLYTGARP
jgi:TusA-related sulfurtransferase